MFSNSRLNVEQRFRRSYNIAKLYYQNKDYNAAKDLVNELFELKPNSPEAFKLLSQINEAMGDNELAIQNYKKSLEVKSADNNNFFNDYTNYSSSTSKLKFLGGSNSLNLNSLTTGKNNLNSSPRPAEPAIDQTEFMKNVEKMIDGKFSILMNSFQDFKEHFSRMNSSVNINKELSQFKDINPILNDVCKRIAELKTKNEQLEKLIINQANNKTDISSTATIKQELVHLSKSFQTFSTEINRKIDDLNEKLNNMKLNNDDEYEDYCDDDYEDEDRHHGDDYGYEGQDNYDGQHQQQENQQPRFGANLPKLNEMFKPKQNSWTCSTCCVMNDESQTVCASCEEPRYPMSQPPQPASKAQSLFGAPTPSTGFIPPPMLQPASGMTIPTAAPAPAPPVSQSFVFGGFKFPQSNTNSTSSETPTTSTTMAKPIVTTSNSSASPFSFSTALNQTKTSPFGQQQQNKDNMNTGSISNPFPSFGNALNFNNKIGNESTNNKATTTTTASNPAAAPTFTFFTQTTPPSFKPNLNAPLNFSTPTFNSSLTTTITNSTTSPSSQQPKPSLFNNAPSAPNSSMFQFGNMPPNNTFSSPVFGKPLNLSGGLVFEMPKNTSSSSLLNTTPNKEKEDEVEDVDTTVDDNLILPKVNLPENYQHKTGEEDEMELFHCNKMTRLYILVDGEYKERGRGTLKILRNEVSKKCRLLMRRDQVHKVCLNAPLTPEFKLEFKGKYLLFQCIDFSDNKPSANTYLLRISNVNEFKAYVEELVKNPSQTKPFVPKEPTNETPSKEEQKKTDDDDDCKIVFERKPKPEHLKMIETLKLPMNFYSYEEKAPCKGCIGCRVDELSWQDLTYSAIEVNNSNNKQPESSPNLGLFSNLSSNVPESKIDSIQTNMNSNVDAQSFVSEKSKLLPQNYKHTTGEENETVIHSERAKLYRYIRESNEIKERGVGEIKILKNPETSSYRLLMRRDIILNIICNHKLTKDLDFKDKDAKSCMWGTKDFSENPQGDDQIFLLRFKDEKRKADFIAKAKQCVQNP